MTSANHRRLATAVCCLAVVGFFLYYHANNDHFDRLARARQIAVYGDVPFRDFFDPGYFLTLYASALMQRLLGDNLLGEMLLNIGAMAAGTTLVFLLASRASGSSLWGLAAAGMTMLGEPRGYDYDKVLFYPLGLWACWHYIDRPTMARLLSLAGITVLAALFRYDSGVYLGAAAFITLAVSHARDWRVGVRRTATLVVAMLLFAAPALAFIQATAGLDDAFNQIVTYARREGARSSIFRMSSFDIDWSLPFVAVHQSPSEAALWGDGGDTTWASGFLRTENADAWLHWLGVAVPVLVVLIIPLRRNNRESPTLARALSYAGIGELTALFILREPVGARIGGVMPVITVGAGLLVGEWRSWMKMARSAHTARIARELGLLAMAAAPCVLTLASLWGLFSYPPVNNLRVGRRLLNYAEVPPKLSLIPVKSMEPIADYIRTCTKPTDRFFVPWFAGELYFFSGRGFAAGLPVVFGDHWSESHYQSRALRILEGQSVPIILMHGSELKSYPSLWTFVREHYELADRSTFGSRTEVDIWVRRGLPVTGHYGEFALPCYGS